MRQVLEKQKGKCLTPELIDGVKIPPNKKEKAYGKGILFKSSKIVLNFLRVISKRMATT